MGLKNQSNYFFINGFINVKLISIKIDKIRSSFNPFVYVILINQRNLQWIFWLKFQT